MKLAYKKWTFKIELNEMFEVLNCKSRKRKLTILAILSHESVE